MYHIEIYEEKDNKWSVKRWLNKKRKEYNLIFEIFEISNL